MSLLEDWILDVTTNLILISHVTNLVTYILFTW